MDSIERTHAFTRQLAQSPLLYEDGLTHQQRLLALAEVASEMAMDYVDTNTLPTANDQAINLSAWHHDLRADCSEIFKGETSGKDNHRQNRAEANQTDVLTIFNAARIGVRAAMNQAYARTKDDNETTRSKRFFIDHLVET
jgi:hypothetical protein